MSDQERNREFNEAEDGYIWPEYLVQAGFDEWQKTGRRPNPYELARRMVKSFNDDMDHFGLLVDKMRPKPKDNTG